MQIYATFDISGRPTGYYCDAIHGSPGTSDCTIPASAEEISEDDYQTYLAESGKWLRNPKTGQRVAAPPLPSPTRDELLADIKAERDRQALPIINELDRHRNQKEYGLTTTLSDDEATARAVLLQKLRDFPATCDPFNPIWPVIEQ